MALARFSRKKETTREPLTRRRKRKPSRPPVIERRLIRFLAALLTLVTLTYIISWGGTPLDIRQGQRATRHYFARGAFSWRDERKTEENRRDAARRAPNVYDQDLSALGIIEKDLLDLCKLLMLPAGEDELRRRHVIDSVVYEDEQEEGHWKIKVRSKGSDELDLVALTGLLNTRDAEQYIRNSMMPRQFGDFPPEFSSVIPSLIARRLKPTLIYNDDLSAQEEENARGVAPEETRTVRAGELMLREGEIAKPELIQMLERENRTYWSSMTPFQRLRRVAGIAIVVAVIIAISAVYVTRFHPTSLTVGRALVVGIVCLAFVVAARFLAAVHLTYLLPISASAILFTILFSPTFALGISFLLVLLLGFALSYDFTAMLTFLSGCVVAVLGSMRIRNRTRLIKVGALIGLAKVATLWGMWLASQWETLPLEWRSPLVLNSALVMVSGVGVGFLLSGALPFIERLFNVVTDISLLELSDQNHPLLRRLLLEAPGTYHHSFIVGTLSEAASEAIGANALVARIASYYHDVGKVARPEYFVENQTGRESRHDSLTPAMSALIIISHVKEGLEMARAQRLPPRLVELIGQHHGTSLVEYFYQAALTRSNDNERISEEPFRYPGPKAQTKEAAIILLADAVEAASRTLSEPSPARIERFVDEIVARRLADGQLDESTLTLTEVGKLKQSFSRVLTGIYHSRIKYPHSDSKAPDWGRTNAKLQNTKPAEKNSQSRLAMENPDKQPAH